MRILLVSQMYPSAAEPDHGVFVARMEEALVERGHEIVRAVESRRGSRWRYLDLARAVRAAPPVDVVYAHFLVPSGLLALQAGAPLVVTAHGRDVRNIGVLPGITALTRRVVSRAAAVVCVSEYLREELETKLPEARGKTEVVSMGVDLDRFAPPAHELDGPTRYLCLGGLTQRKNVVRLADAFGRLGGGTLTFVGDGPLRSALEGRERVTLLGPRPHDEVPALVRDHHVLCQPSLIEPLGQSVLEGMAAGRTVVASRIGGAQELVPPDAGFLVDPLDADGLTRALGAAAALPRPNEAARSAAAAHDVRRQAARVEEILLRAARAPRA